MDIRKVIKKVLSEAVTGDAAAEAGAKASLAAEKVKNRMASMGVSVPDIEHLFSIEQLKVEPFKLSFVLQKVVDKPQDLSMPETEEFSGLAKVVDDSKNLVLDFKPYVNGGLSEKVFKIVFLTKEINTNLPGTDKTIKALSSKGKFYHIQIPTDLINLYDEEEGDEEGDSKQNQPKGVDTPEIEQIKKDLELLKTSGGIDKQGNKFPQAVIDTLIKQKETELNNLIQKNKKSSSQQLEIPFPESFKRANNLILEGDDADSHVVMEITISDIELGSKGKAKRSADITNTFGRRQKGGIFIKDPKWDGKVLPVKAQIQTQVTDLPNKDLQHYVNTGVENLMLRKSKSDPNNIILYFNDRQIDRAIVIKILNPNKDLFSGPINVEIGVQALGDRKITDPFKAVLQLAHR